MFSRKSPPEPIQDLSGVEFKLKLSEATLVKLVSWIVTVLIGSSGIWLRTQTISPPDIPSKPAGAVIEHQD